MLRFILFLSLFILFTQPIQATESFQCEAILEKVSGGSFNRDMNSPTTYTAFFKVVTFPKNVRVSRTIKASFTEDPRFRFPGQVTLSQISKFRGKKQWWGFSKSGRIYKITKVPEVMPKIPPKEFTFKNIQFTMPITWQKIGAEATRFTTSKDLSLTISELAIPTGTKEDVVLKEYLKKHLPRAFGKTVKVGKYTFRRFDTRSGTSKIEAWTLSNRSTIYAFKFIQSNNKTLKPDEIMQIIKTVKFKN